MAPRRSGSPVRYRPRAAERAVRLCETDTAASAVDERLRRLLEIYPPRQAQIWMTSFNAHLGSRPVDVLRLRGAGPVI